MSRLRQAVKDYLAVRRALGYNLRRAEKLLDQFLTYVERAGDTHLRIATMVLWATQPQDAHESWYSYRLSVVRAFASHLHAIDPTTEIPSTDLLPWLRCRATPYLYSDEEVGALISAATTLRTPYRVATYQTLVSLLAATGMRVGEALALDCADIDGKEGLLTIRHGKFGKSRELLVHATTTAALDRYLRRCDRPVSTRTAAVFLSTAGTRLLYCNVQWTFQRLVRRANLKPRSAACRPRIHDLRHRFAVATIIDGYRTSGNAETRLSLLSTYLGHVDTSHTYWYLSAAPELMQLAANRLDRLEGVS
jgi:integrase